MKKKYTSLIFCTLISTYAFVYAQESDNDSSDEWTLVGETQHSLAKEDELTNALISSLDKQLSPPLPADNAQHNTRHPIVHMPIAPAQSSHSDDDADDEQEHDDIRPQHNSQAELNPDIGRQIDEDLDELLQATRETVNDIKNSATKAAGALWSATKWILQSTTPTVPLNPAEQLDITLAQIRAGRSEPSNEILNQLAQDVAAVREHNIPLTPRQQADILEMSTYTAHRQAELKQVAKALSGNDE